MKSLHRVARLVLALSVLPQENHAATSEDNSPLLYSNTKETEQINFESETIEQPQPIHYTPRQDSAREDSVGTPPPHDGRWNKQIYKLRETVESD